MSSQNLIRFGELAFPPQPHAIFGREGPLVLEVGFGNGRFLAEMAQLHPDWNLLGAEKAAASVSRAYVRLRGMRVPNARIMHAGARFCLREIVPEGSLHRVFVNFPDPWPKEVHVGRRLLREGFFRLLSTRLEDGGQLRLTTDHRQYLEYAVAEGEASGLFEVSEQAPPPEMLRTKYAERWSLMKKTIGHAVFQKRAVDSSPHPPQLRTVAMHHIRLEGSLGGIDSFEKKAYQRGQGQVILLTAYRTFDEHCIVFRVMVQSPDLRQEVLVEARPSKSAIYVSLMNFGSPVITPLVREAVRVVASWLQERGLRLIQEAV